KTVNTVYEVPLSLPHATYFWRVRAVDSGGHTAFSATRTFLRDWSVGFNMLQTPTAGDPTLAWQPVPKASVYKVRFSTDPEFVSDVFTCFTNETTFTPYATTATETTP